MPVAGALLLAGLLAQASTSSPATPAQGTDVAAPSATAQSVTQSNDGTPTASDPVHEVGVGASMGVGTRSSGAGLRYFFGDRVGLNANVSWYAPTPLNQSQGGRLLVAPSVVYMLTKSKKYAAVDVRPYLGGGVNYATGFGSTPSVVAGSTTLANRTSGLGMQAFGGVEFTFQDARNFALSGEVVHYEIAGGALADGLGEGTNFYVLVHYYMR